MFVLVDLALWWPSHPNSILQRWYTLGGWWNKSEAWRKWRTFIQTSYFLRENCSILIQISLKLFPLVQFTISLILLVQKFAKQATSQYLYHRCVNSLTYICCTGQQLVDRKWTLRNPSPPGVTYMRQWIGSALVQIMACRIFGVKSLATNVRTILIGPLGTNFSEILIEIHTFSFEKTDFKNVIYKMAKILSRPQCVLM